MAKRLLRSAGQKNVGKHSTGQHNAAGAPANTSDDSSPNAGAGQETNPQSQAAAQPATDSSGSTGTARAGKAWNAQEVRLITAHLPRLARTTPQGKALFYKLLRECNAVRDAGVRPATATALESKVRRMKVNVAAAAAASLAEALPAAAPTTALQQNNTAADYDSTVLEEALEDALDRVDELESENWGLRSINQIQAEKVRALESSTATSKGNNKQEP